MPINTRNLFIGLQLVSIATSVILLSQGIGGDFNSKEVEAVGGTLTLVLIFGGAYCHRQAKLGVILFPPMILIAAIPAAYAWLGGELRHVITYHGVSLGFFMFVWWNFEKTRKATDAKAEADRAAGTTDEAAGAESDQEPSS